MRGRGEGQQMADPPVRGQALLFQFTTVNFSKMERTSVPLSQLINTAMNINPKSQGQFVSTVPTIRSKILSQIVYRVPSQLVK